MTGQLIARGIRRCIKKCRSLFRAPNVIYNHLCRRWLAYERAFQRARSWRIQTETDVDDTVSFPSMCSYRLLEVLELASIKFLKLT